MALPLSTKRHSRGGLRAPGFCLFAVLLSLCSCNKKLSEDPTEKLNRLNEYLEEQGIKRVPPTSFAFPPLVDATELRSTTVAMDLSAKIPVGKNVVYCATSKFADAFVEQARTGQAAAPAGVADELPAGSYRLIKGTPDEVRAGLVTDFPSAAEPLDLLSEEPWLWCCNFRRSLPFLEAFNRLDDPLAFHSFEGVVDIECFGDRDFQDDSAKQFLRKRQVTIIDFKNEDDFIIRLNTEVKDDEFILAKVTPEESLQLTLEGVMRRVKKNRLDGTELSELRDCEALVIPIVTVSLFERFPKQPNVIQTIQFRLDEEGAKLESALMASCLPEQDVLRQMVFDKPFLLYLKSKTADVPYFVLWVENLEVLEAFVPEPEAEQASTKEQP